MPVNPIPTNRPTGTALVATLAKAGRPVAEIVTELEASETYRRHEFDGKTKKQKRGADDWVPDLDGWEFLAEEVPYLPVEVGVALMTGRPQLILGMSPERLAELCRDTASVRGLLDLIRVLLATNAMLKLHCERVANRVEGMFNGLRGAVAMGQRLRDFAAFREPPAGDDPDADDKAGC